MRSQRHSITDTDALSDAQATHRRHQHSAETAENGENERGPLDRAKGFALNHM